MTYADTVLKKLQSFMVVCGGAKIHDVRVQIATLQTYINMQGDARFNQANVEQWLCEAVEDAENFLKKAVR